MKVTNQVDSREPEFLAGQNAAMAHLASKGFSCPRPVPNLRKDLLSLVKLKSFMVDSQLEEGDSEEEPCVVRILTFLPGKTLYEVSPWTPDLFYQAGQFIANMDVAWKDFHHPVFTDRKFIWLVHHMVERTQK